MQHDVDISKYEAKMVDISKIYNEYIEILMSGKCEDIDKTVAEMNEKLEAKGINEIIDDINRQMRGE